MRRFGRALLDTQIPSLVEAGIIRFHVPLLLVGAVRFGDLAGRFGGSCRNVYDASLIHRICHRHIPPWVVVQRTFGVFAYPFVCGIAYAIPMPGVRSEKGYGIVNAPIGTFSCPLMPGEESRFTYGDFQRSPSARPVKSCIHPRYISVKYL